MKKLVPSGTRYTSAVGMELDNKDYEVPIKVCVVGVCVSLRRKPC